MPTNTLDPVDFIAELERSLEPGQRIAQAEFDYEGLETAYLEDLYPDRPISSGDAESWAGAQGAIGNCGTIANIVALAACQGSVTVETSIYPITPSRTGCYCVRFADGDNYQWIVIDSQVPIGRGRPKFCRPKGSEAGIWAPLLEKACATIRGGSYRSLTNQAEEKIPFPGWFPHSIIKSTVWEDVLQTLNIGGYGITTFPKQKDASGNIVYVSGLVSGHAFAIADAIMAVDVQGDPHPLVRIENPWGGGADYQGRYRDGGQFWRDNPHLQQLEQDSLQSGGNWWMAWDELMAARNGKPVKMIKPKVSLI